MNWNLPSASSATDDPTTIHFCRNGSNLTIAAVPLVCGAPFGAKTVPVMVAVASSETVTFAISSAASDRSGSVPFSPLFVAAIFTVPASTCSMMTSPSAPVVPFRLSVNPSPVAVTVTIAPATGAPLASWTVATMVPCPCSCTSSSMVWP